MSKNLTDKIVLVLKKSARYNIPQAYIVEPFNKKQLESARKWGSDTSGDPFTKTTTQVEPIEILTDNKDFILEFDESANTSYQGGKLSFWNCIIRKDPDINCLVGIDQDSLLSLIKQSTIKNGIVQEGVSLIKTSTAGAIHPGMKEWQELTLVDNSKRAPKTTKWKLGQSYKTINNDDMYVCDLYKTYETRDEIVQEQLRSSIYGRVGTTQHVETHIKLNSKPILVKCISNIIASNVEAGVISGDITTLEGLMDSYLDKIVNTSNTYRLGYIDYFSPLSWRGKTLEKFPSRELGKYSLQVNDDSYIKSKLNQILTELRNRIEKEIDQLNNISIDLITRFFGYTVNPDDKIELSDEFKNKLLNITSRSVYIDFGDGEEHRGRK